MMRYNPWLLALLLLLLASVSRSLHGFDTPLLYSRNVRWLSYRVIYPRSRCRDGRGEKGRCSVSLYFRETSLCSPDTRTTCGSEWTTTTSSSSRRSQGSQRFTTMPLSCGCRSSRRSSSQRVHPPILRQSSCTVAPCPRHHRLQVFPNTPFIEASDTWGNWAVLLGTASAAQVLGITTQIGRLLGPPVTAMAVTFALATVGVLSPGGTRAAQDLQLLALQLATPLILLGASNALRQDAVQQCGPLLGSFALASLATLLACVVGWQLTGPALQAALGTRDGLVIAAALLAKNIGGGINYIAVCQALQASPTAVAAGLCVDNLFALVYFPVTSALASGRPDVTTAPASPVQDTLIARPGDVTSSELAPSATTTSTPVGVSVQTVSNVLSLAAGLLWLSEKFLGGGLPACTVLTLLVARLAPRTWLPRLQPSADCLGTVALYVFFATAGAPGLAVAESVRTALLPLGAFLACLYSIHGLFLYAIHQVFGRSKGGQRSHPPALAPQRLLVASSAAIGGPATAVALAQASNWDSLKVPSLLVGNLGYAIATFCGLAYFSFFRSSGGIMGALASTVTVV